MLPSSSMAPKIILAAFFVIFSLKFYSAKSETWVKGGYWYSGSGFPSSDINSALFTHLFCAFADVNSTSYELFLSASDEKEFSNFTDTVKQKNPSVSTLLSIGGGNAKYSTLSTMPGLDSGSFPVKEMEQYLDWANVMAYDFYSPQWAWISGGLSSNKVVLNLPFYGYAWTLANAQDNGIGAPATGPATTEDGDMSYKDIRDYVLSYGANILYNATYVVNYCTIGTSWIGFDDVEVVKIKVAYAKEKKLLGYNAWQISHDDNWILS
ncbi:hypothetical protein Pint_14603 [Pistacia integerrima]|uniref:Uncharacterized protein n=1 Tax=Pistacia integerrima TaxID=434235 RepID=A0ACC0Y7T2_9ROSI|nr:hypothetical protein Pint_14603 [Pistacia integerrima]